MTTVNERAARIRMVVLDIDGVMSDGTINVSGTSFHPLQYILKT